MKTNFLRIMTPLIAGLFASPAFASINVTQTTTAATLAAAAAGTGLTSVTATVNAGNSAQFGTYTNFNTGPLQLPNGIVMSTGEVVQTPESYAEPLGYPEISTNFGDGSTPEYTTYATGRVANFSAAYDVASLTINFSLATSSAVAFNWAFGSVEYPVYTSEYTDAVFAFLDGTVAADQILFDSGGNPVQVGNSFAGSLITDDTNTAFAGTHGIIGLLTTTGVLSAGSHSLTFEIGDTNDGNLDSAIFFGPLSTSNSTGSGPVTNPTGAPDACSTAFLMALSLLGLVAIKRKFSASCPGADIC